MATITLTITKDGTEADPNSGDHATVVFDDSDKPEAIRVLSALKNQLRYFDWQDAFEYVKEREREQNLAAESSR